ncbi:flippase [Clostridium sp. Marseille-P3244]|uniref:flippase n=1 Tax=Clostridium sp. Marseille-P3244 TaxID=1871020 RepID=UPI0009308C23|nr:flippase [Clostridium sp. Marseille-P3244]
MKKRTVAENLFYNMLYQVIVTILPVITTPYTARVLGLHANGIHSFTESIVTYFIIFGSLGTSLYGIRKVAYVRENEEQLAQTTIEIILLKLILMAGTLLVYVPVLCIGSEYAYIYRIQIINIVANGIDISWFYQGVEDFKKVTIRNLVVKAVFVVALFTMIRSPEDLSKYVFLIVASSLLGNILMLYYLPQYVRLKIHGRLHPLSHVKGSILLFIPQVMNYVYALLDRSMLGWMTHTDNVGIYDQAQRLIRMITAILQSLGYVMMARVANLTMANDEEGIRQYIQKSINFTMFLAWPAMFGVIGVADDFIPLFLGEEYLDVVPILKILSVLILTMSLNSILGVQMLIPMGKEKVYAAATSTGAVVNVIVNIVTIPLFGTVGACISSLAAETAVFLISYFNLRKMIDPIRVIKTNFPVIVSSLVMYGAVRLISMAQINIIVKLGLEVIVGGGLYMLLMLITRNEILLIIMDKVGNYLKRLTGRKM